MKPIITPQASRQVAALFVRADSVYKRMPGVDCWDAERDAMNYNGPHPVVTHPPCRLWGNLSHFSKAPMEEKDLAVRAVELVRKFGGVLEHPAYSKLWKHLGLEGPAHELDEFGGQTIALNQFAFGHKAAKPTWLYIVRCAALPTLPVEMGLPTHCICRSTRALRRLPHVSMADRERTPPAFAAWLVEVARRTLSTEH